MSKDWTPEDLVAASAAMKARGEMSYEEFCAHLELCTEKVVAVHLADGDTITTRIHGTEQDIRDYYRIGLPQYGRSRRPAGGDCCGGHRGCQREHHLTGP